MQNKHSGTNIKASLRTIGLNLSSVDAIMNLALSNPDSMSCVQMTEMRDVVSPAVYSRNNKKLIRDLKNLGIYNIMICVNKKDTVKYLIRSIDRGVVDLTIDKNAYGRRLTLQEYTAIALIDYYNGHGEQFSTQQVSALGNNRMTLADAPIELQEAFIKTLSENNSIL